MTLDEFKFANLSEAQKNSLISAVTSMKGVLEEILGEEGDELWQNVVDLTMPGLKLQVLQNAFTQKYGDSVTITGTIPNFSLQKVAAIKAIREATGFGLKESKDIIDVAHTGKNVTIKVTNKTQTYNWTTGTYFPLEDTGMEIGQIRALLISVLAQAGYNAV